LERHAVTLSQNKHLVFASGRELANVPETKSRPKFTDTASNQISVIVEICSGTQRPDLVWIIEALQVEHLAARNFFEHKANVAAVCVFHSFKTS
jgi:hypothetical protein